MKYNEEEKAMWLEDWKQSGKKAWAYAKENSLVPQTFCSWTRRGIKAKAGFVKIRQELISPSQAERIIIESGSIKIHIPPGLSGSELGTVIKSIRAAL